METFQNILVLITFLIAVGYLVTKFIWKPSFLSSGSDKENACGKDDCGCH
ncbi:MAG: hypothetical protein WBG71_07430 [Leeuwenhoekiella sp.]